MAFSPVSNSVIFQCKVNNGDILVVKAFINGEEKATTEMPIAFADVPAEGLTIQGSITVFED